MNQGELQQCLQNRELSWLKFNERVLEEAMNKSNPLLERLKFTAIFSSNLDEFFMIRVGSLIDLMQYDTNYRENKTNMTAEEQLDKIYAACILLYEQKDRAYKRINHECLDQGMGRKRVEDLDRTETRIIEEHFRMNILPILSPQIIDSRHPFPHLDNKQLQIAAVLEYKEKDFFGLISVPKILDRTVFINKSEYDYVLCEDIILHFAEQIFDMYKVNEKTLLTVTRNADMDTDEVLYDEGFDYRLHMKNLIKKRKRLAPVRIELQSSVGDKFLKYLCTRFELRPRQIFLSESPLEMSYVFGLEDKLAVSIRREVCYLPFVPQMREDLKTDSMIQQVMKRDILLSYPYESMQPFLTLMKEAANDSHTISIKIVLYRIAHQSKLAEYLINAAENGKEVTVLMELRARFDEENNIEWAQRFEEAGCRVIYGMIGFKVHSKLCLITRKERGKVQYITQVGTGNYNEKTAKIYSDYSLLTTNSEIGNDAMNFFKNMSISNLDGSYSQLWVAPVNLRSKLIAAIDTEIEKVAHGLTGQVIIKANSLTDLTVIKKLIEASQKGVSIKLIIRGICCLIPDVPGCTDHIEVISIVGRFLEHARVYCFGSDREMQVYIASADMMTRNTERRVEIACPMLSYSLRMCIYQMLETMLADNVKSRVLLSNGAYVYKKDDQSSIDAQSIFLERLQADPISETINEKTVRVLSYIKDLPVLAMKLIKRIRK